MCITLCGQELGVNSVIPNPLITITLWMRITLFLSLTSPLHLKYLHLSEWHSSNNIVVHSFWHSHTLGKIKLLFLRTVHSLIYKQWLQLKETTAENKNLSTCLKQYAAKPIYFLREYIFFPYVLLKSNSCVISDNTCSVKYNTHCSILYFLNLSKVKGAALVIH